MLARGFYTVTRFEAFTPKAGSLVATGLVDAIGDLHESHSGILRVRVAFWVHGTIVARGVMRVFCALPGAPANLEEGVTVVARLVGSSIIFNFDEKEPDNGPTNFHIIQ